MSLEKGTELWTVGRNVRVTCVRVIFKVSRMYTQRKAGCQRELGSGQHHLRMFREGDGGRDGQKARIQKCATEARKECL